MNEDEQQQAEVPERASTVDERRAEMFRRAVAPIPTKNPEVPEDEVQA